MRLLSLALLLAAPSVADQDVIRSIRIGTNSQMPMSYLSPEGEPTGFYVEVLREAARRERLPLQMVVTRESADKALENGLVDLWAVAVPTPERQAKFHLTRPWWNVSNYLAAVSSSAIRGPLDLAGRTVGYPTTPRLTVPLTEFLPGAQFKVVESLPGRIQALCSGQADAILFYEPSFNSVFGSTGSADCRNRGLRIIPIQRPVMELSIMSSVANRDLAERLRSAIGEMQRDGSMERLPSFHLTSNEQLKAELAQERKRSREQLLLFGIFAALVLLAGAAFAYLRLRAAHAKVNAALQIAQEANRAKSRFLATMSHEIRTPMTAVLGYMQMLSTTDLSLRQEQFCREVTHATTSLLAMITGVLDYSRSTSGPIAVENVPFEPISILDESLSAVLIVAHSKKLSLRSNLDPSVPAMLIGDPARLRQLCLNLLSNAIKFTSQGWVSISANYSIRPNKAILRIEVADSGIGIPVEKQDIIFHPFTQIDSTNHRSYGGIGLGLAIVSNICRELKGTVTCTSKPGEGSTFTVELPMNSAPPHQGWLEALRIFGPATAVALWQDCPNTRALAAYLSAVGCKLTEASSVEEWMHCAADCAVQRGFFFLDARLWNDAADLALRTWTHSRSGVRLVLLDLEGSFRDVAMPFDTILRLPVSGRAFAELLRPIERALFPQPLSEPLEVLVADDNNVNRRLLSILLEKLGCRPSLATNGLEAAEMANSQAYSLILMDCQMPVLDGFDATRRIRSGTNATIPIWGISAALEPEVLEQCLECGMNGYLSKPIGISELQTVLIACQRN